MQKMMRCTMSKANAIDVCASIVGRVWPCVAHFVKPSRLLQFFGKSSDGNHISIWAWWLSRLNTSRAWLKKHQLHCVSLWNGMLETFSASGGKHTQNLHRWWMCLWFWLYFPVPKPIYVGCADAQVMKLKSGITSCHHSWLGLLSFNLMAGWNVRCLQYLCRHRWKGMAMRGTFCET